MNKKQFISLVIGFFLFFGSGVAFAEPVLWSGNGHYYDVVEDATNMSWEEARNWASRLTYTDASGQLFKGYLATITSLQEDDFIASLNFTKENYLLGGYQTPVADEATSTEKKANWHWITGEEWEYTDWRSGEPNNFFRWVGVVGAGRSEEYLQYFPVSSSGSWNDVYTGTFTDDAGEHFFGIRNFVVEYEAAVSLLIVTVDGVNVNFDWSAMPAANTYTLAVALSDAVGNVDMSSLNLLDMRTRKTFSTSGLTSGMIFYATILAETAQGLEVSNTCQFMPIAGSVTFPGNNGVLMQVDDPGGIGHLMVSGNMNGDTVNITQITGDDGSGPFVLTVADDKPATYIKGDLTLNFTCLADGSVVVQSVRNRAEASAQDVLDCQERIKGLMASSDIWFARESRRLTGMIEVLGSLWLSSGGNVTPTGLKLGFLIEILKGAKKSNMERYFTKMASLEQEYEECSSEPDPDPDPDNPVIIIDTTCPIPAGAEFFEDNKDGKFPATYWILGTDFVGPKKHWWPKADGSKYLHSEICLNAQGQKNGWLIVYYQDGTMNYAEYYNNGVQDGHMYSFYEDGSLKKDYTYVNGVRTYGLVYGEDGNITMWYDRDGDGVWHRQ